jgi:hypothetical protein
MQLEVQQNLESNTTDAEATRSKWLFNFFDSDGFTLGSNGLLMQMENICCMELVSKWCWSIKYCGKYYINSIS